MDVPKQEFQRIWGRGYSETFEAAGYAKVKDQVPPLIRRFADPEGTALDIGCGSCLWTGRWIAPYFKRTIALDVISAPSECKSPVEYRQVADQDFSCAGIEDGSIDFAFSMGCFCHLSNSANLAYLNSAHRVLKPGGNAILMFANWPAHPDLAQHVETGKTRNREEAGPGWWFYNDTETVAQMAAQTGFTLFTNLIPDCRDLFVLFSKSCC